MTFFVWGFTGLMILCSVLVDRLQGSMVALFLCCCAAIIPLAGLMGRATESIAAHSGPRIGGLLSATFGNAVELIIGIIALRDGMTALVKASITGSILGNLLLVLGVSFFVGGIRHPIQRFNIRAARSNSAMLVMGVVLAFAVPSIFAAAGAHAAVTLSTAVAVVSLVIYMLGLLFTLFTHRDLFMSIESVNQTGHSHTEDKQSLRAALLVLLIATVLVGLESEWLVKSLEVMGHHFRLSELFMGVVVIAIVGNAAEHASAVWMAWKNRMDLSLEIAIGSSLQVSMFVAPVLFLASLLVGHVMPLLFSWPEVLSMASAVLLVVVLMMDGESNWLEGAMGVGAYALIAIGFLTLSG